MTTIAPPQKLQEKTIIIESLLRTEEELECRKVRYGERPVTFGEFVELPEKSEYELVNGVLVERMAAQREHESLFAWLISVTKVYADKRDLGVVYGSRTAVKINDMGGRLPDLLFVRKDRLNLVQSKAIYGTPDLVIELVSSGDRRGDLVALETDYGSIELPELVFMDLQKQQVRVLRLRAGTQVYDETVLTTGVWEPDAIPGLRLNLDWLLREPRPDAFDTLVSLLTP